VSKNRTVSLILALALCATGFAPRTALGGRLPYEEELAATDAPEAAAPAEPASADAADEPDAPDAQQPKRKGNAFARALAAPFRALARLFGGGRKSTSEEAKRRKASPSSQGEPEAAAQAKQEVTQAPQTPQAAPDASQANSGAPQVTSDANGAGVAEVKSPPPAAGPRPSEGARVVRPVEAGAFIEPPKTWIPVIEGISKDPLTQGRALLEHGYVQEAVAELTVAATQVGPGLVEANNLLGIAYDRMGWHTQAAEAYNRALVVAPKDPVVIANLGYSLYLADDYAGALRRLRQAAKLAPGTPAIYNNLGVVLARARDYGGAFKYFSLASNEYDAHLKLASILEDQHRDRDAIKHYEAALRMQPDASAILERLVALYERTGERDKADTARKALGQPKNPQKTNTGGG
jgi:Flp pilus assembly protein TadD